MNTAAVYFVACTLLFTKTVTGQKNSKGVPCQNIFLCRDCDNECHWCEIVINGVHLRLAHCQSNAYPCDRTRYPTFDGAAELAGSKWTWVDFNREPWICLRKDLTSQRPETRCEDCTLDNNSRWCQIDMVVDKVHYKAAGGYCSLITHFASSDMHTLPCIRSDYHAQKYLGPFGYNVYPIPVHSCPKPRCSSHTSCYTCRKDHCVWCSATVKHATANPTDKEHQIGGCVGMPKTHVEARSMCDNVNYHAIAAAKGYLVAPNEYILTLPKNRLTVWESCAAETCASITHCSECTGACKWCEATLDGRDFLQNTNRTNLAHCQDASQPCDYSLYGSLDGMFAAAGRNFKVSVATACPPANYESPLAKDVYDCQTCHNIPNARWCQIDLAGTSPSFTPSGGLCLKKVAYYPNIDCTDIPFIDQAEYIHGYIVTPSAVSLEVALTTTFAAGQTYKVQVVEQGKCPDINCSGHTTCKACQETPCVWCGLTVKDASIAGAAAYQGTVFGRCVSMPRNRKALKELCSTAVYPALARVLQYKLHTHDYQVESATVTSAKGLTVCDDTSIAMETVDNCYACDLATGSFGKWCELSRTDESGVTKGGVCFSRLTFAAAEEACKRFEKGRSGDDVWIQGRILTKCGTEIMPTEKAGNSAARGGMPVVVLVLGLIFALLQ